MEKYIIKQNTVYIHGIKIDNHIVHSEICEAGKDPFMVKSKPQEIMNQSCRFYGEHFNERKQFTKRLTNITSKPPILVSPIISTYFFCTNSERTPENTWLNLLYVKEFIPLKGNKTKIILEKAPSFIFNISKHVINHQYLNCTCLHYRNHRKNLFIRELNSVNLGLNQEGYNVLDVIDFYLNKNNYKK